MAWLFGWLAGTWSAAAAVVRSGAVQRPTGVGSRATGDSPAGCFYNILYLSQKLKKFFCDDAHFIGLVTSFTRLCAVLLPRREVLLVVMMLLTADELERAVCSFVLFLRTYIWMKYKVCLRSWLRRVEIYLVQILTAVTPTQATCRVYNLLRAAARPIPRLFAFDLEELVVYIGGCNPRILWQHGRVYLVCWNLRR